VFGGDECLSIATLVSDVKEEKEECSAVASDAGAFAMSVRFRELLRV